ncbi:serine protease [Orbilia ellipsospora]|uniref:Serine protease n=1 Tax=Orbilia ellipsospora TaxID=2528407 RepID=A0AAV9WWG9_9PEZI
MKSQPLLIFFLTFLPSTLSAPNPTILSYRSLEKPPGISSTSHSGGETNYIITLKPTEKRPWSELLKSFGHANQPETVIAKSVRMYGLKLTPSEADKISKSPFVAGVQPDIDITVPADKISNINVDADTDDSASLSQPHHARRFTAGQGQGQGISVNPALAARAALKEQKDATWALQRISSGQKVEKRPDGKNRKYLYTYDPKTDVGTGVDVYIVDSGVDLKNSEFEGRAKQIYSLSNKYTEDQRGHGTHVAGIIGSKSFGVAKKVNLISVKILPARGENAALRQILEGIDKAIESHVNRRNEPGFVASIMNLSVGGRNPETAPLQILLTMAAAEGMHIVAAAGNERTDACRTFPAGWNRNIESLITVGNIDINDGLEVDSNFGECVDIFAPGTDILSVAVPKLAEKKKVVAMTGTSMAGPMVVGVMAGQALKHENLRKNPVAMKKHMIKEMTKKGIHNYKSSQGPDRILFRGD